MREIKFRAWDNWSKEMIQDAFYFNEKGMCSASVAYKGQVDWTIMQYTGLKDKNGKEIYEGDVVKYRKCCDRCGGDTGDVFWQDGAFYVRIASDEFMTLTGAYGSFEIIGNIWEHEHLLNQSTETANK